VLSTLADLSLHLNNLNNLESASVPNIDGLLWPQVRALRFYSTGANSGSWIHPDTMIDLGFVVAAFVPLVLFWMYITTFSMLWPAIANTVFHSFGDNHLRAVWRISLGLGIIPALVVFLWRLNMEEPERFRRDSMRDTKIPYLLVLKRYWKSLLAISFVWCVPPRWLVEKTSTQDPCLGFSTISLCECAASLTSLVCLSLSPTATQFVPSFSDCSCLLRHLDSLEFTLLSSSIGKFLKVFFSYSWFIMALSVTGGSQSLTVVFGWSVVIKYVLSALYMLNFTEQFLVCLISQASHKSVGPIGVSHVSCRFRNARWSFHPWLSGSQVYYGRCEIAIWKS